MPQNSTNIADAQLYTQFNQSNQIYITYITI
jgi:hypothetical protein